MGEHGGTGSLILSRKRFVYDKQQKRVVETDESKALRAAPGTQWRNHQSQSVSIHPKQVGRYRQFVKDMALPGVEIQPATGRFGASYFLASAAASAPASPAVAGGTNLSAPTSAQPEGPSANR